MRDLLHGLFLWCARKTRAPYECYWRDRALSAEAKLAYVLRRARVGKDYHVDLLADYKDK